MTEWLADVVYDEAGLVPAIIQDAGTKEVLTLAYMNETSLKKTVETGETWFYSRSRQELWHKGETSGNTQKVRNITWDCDQGCPSCDGGEGRPGVPHRCGKLLQ